MNSKAFLNKALTLCLSIAIFATYTTVALATPGKAIGDITVLDNSINGEIASVNVNGEVAQNGRTIFSNSTVTTSDNAGAIVNLGKFGRLELAPNTTIAFNTNSDGLAGNLLNGRVTSLTDSSISIFVNGQATKLASGKSVMANKQDDDDDDDKIGGSTWLIYTVIFAGAAGGLIIAALSDNNRVALGGGTNVASPIR